MRDLVMEGVCKPVQLEPFVHQVGGHSSMLKFDESTVCKPLISRERHFYEAMPPELTEFTPEYRGVVEVTFHEDSDGYVTLVAYPPECKRSENKREKTTNASSSPNSSGEGVQSDSDSESSNPPRHIQQRFRMRQSGSIEVEGMQEKMFQLVDPHSKTEKHVSIATHNPWSLRCHQEQLAKMKKNSKNSDVHKFILLENLASNFRLPCILDLKMGTRQHGDDASEEKKQSQIRKCESTTSSTLGVRICGMQVYQAHTGHYVCHNKYYGRRLSDTDVNRTLYEFLHNGYGLQTHLIDPILERLRKLYAMLSDQNKFRFYSSSLLIMYEGCDYVGGSRLGNQSAAESDSSQSSHSQYPQSGTPPVWVSGTTPDWEAGTPADWDASTPGTWDAYHHSNASKDCVRHRPTKVDVRMIDFAHATHQGFRGDRTVHPGPDNGYLFGLENIIRMLEALKQHKGDKS